MDLDSSPTTKLGTKIKLEGTQLTRNNRVTNDLHSSTHGIFGVIPPETILSVLVVDNHLIGTRISSLTKVTTTTTGVVLVEPGRQEPGKNIGTNPRSFSGCTPSLSSTPNNSVFRRSSSQESGGFVPYEHRFPRTIDQSDFHAVRFTTTENSINVLSDLCPLN